MSGSPKISVCMATFNGARYLSQQLESILSQLSPHDEVVISDDSSTDGTLEIVRAFDDPRIRLFPENTFYSPIFNFEHAIKQSTGGIIILSDQDDIWLPNKIELIRERFAIKPASTYLLLFDAEVIDEKGAPLYDSVFQKFRRVGPGLIGNIIDNSYIGCCMAFSRELLEFALPFPRRIPMHDMWLGLIAEIFGKTEFIPIQTMQYRKHNASTTDFRIRFTPWAQIRRRSYLVYALASRYFDRRFKSPTS